ncbi:hypothetical protein MtrunA17_Chr7g0263671 [Medicago truncatula]|uniref:Uncharacterized protein n=1 Tax=Medicago truncatula TaxID=3880 RepID=A0A396H574_MEDTR|nr:uncharacterized protein LOC11432929 isoform X1 [Medicago truncatula]RHN48429.1 hypothetical protein MtrunA17_Chr7g0263671 [Medicago truncatula]
MTSYSDASPIKNDVKDRRLSIIDFLSADDSLLDPVSSNYHQNSENEAWYTPNSKKFEDAATKIEQWENEPQTSETKKKNPKFNLRKSLAWDTAFFTNAGVLDAEELTSIIEGVEKETLPRIEEDVYKSCESISTLGSDSLTFETESVDLEGDLFEDVRASIQKSSNKSKIASAATRMSSSSGIPGLPTRDSGKVGVVPRNKMKASPASRNLPAVARVIGKTTNKNNPTFTQIPQPVAARRESSISKPSKVPTKPSANSTISSKRASLSVPHIISEKDKAKHTNGYRVSLVSRASVIGGSRGTEPKSTILSKLTSGQSISTKTKSATSKSSGSNLSGKSPFNSARRNVIAGTSKPPSSRLPARTPLGFASRNKTESGNSSLSSLISANKLSSSISPASSVSDWSSEASVSTSMPKHMCDSSRSSIDSNSSRKVLSDTNADQGINSQISRSDFNLEGQEAQQNGIISQSVRTASVAAVNPPAPAKPSGLRLPSPKIGFFDGAKSSVRTPRGGAQPHTSVSHGLLKHGAGSSSEGQIKAKLQAVRSITPIANKKVDNQQNPHLNHIDESLDVAIKTSSAEQNVKSPSEMLKGAVKNVEYTSLSHEMERTNYDLCPLTRVDHQDSVYHYNQVDCLIEQVGLVNINSKTQEKINGDSLSFCKTDISFQDKSNGMELSNHKELFDYPKNQELSKGLSTPYQCVTPTSIDMATSARIPFAAKDSFCNMDCTVLTEPATSEIKSTNLPVLESITKENN